MKGSSITEGPQAPIPRSKQQHPLKGEPMPLTLFPTSTILMERSLPKEAHSHFTDGAQKRVPSWWQGREHLVQQPSEHQPGHQAHTHIQGTGPGFFPCPFTFSGMRRIKT